LTKIDCEFDCSWSYRKYAGWGRGVSQTGVSLTSLVRFAAVLGDAAGEVANQIFVRTDALDVQKCATAKVVAHTGGLRGD